ncbi:MAG: hypothetical protein HGB21_03790 [Nitrospirae bacterium]|nr:hypothetical protein [Nitrospirota bacterium]NTW65425.1 hypothetical protein [Nitrospirota bacterium]
MRQRRVIIVSYDPHIRSVLKQFFDARVYETVVFRESTICPVYGDVGECPGPYSCGDLFIVGHALPAMNGIDLLLSQHQRGCKLSASNKAVIAGSLSGEGMATLAALGSTLLQQPLDVSKLEQWVTECENRMDLDRPVAIWRKEGREACHDEVLSILLAHDTVEHATVVNKSKCGICAKTSRPMLPNQIIRLRADSLGINDDALVRWVKAAGNGTFLVGLSLCI